jgi:integrase
MGLLQECPACKKRFSLARESCGCGFKMKKFSGKTYWIEFYEFGRRKRERIGPNKEAAQQRLRDVLKARTEERYIEKDPAARLSLGELCAWYLDLPEVRAKDSFERDRQLIAHLKRLLGSETKIKNITAGKVESYQQKRLEEPSRQNKKESLLDQKPEPIKMTAPATVNREISCLKTIFNRAVRHRRLLHNQIGRVKRLYEENIRERILTPEEFERLLAACPLHIRPIVEIAFLMGLRRGEIVTLTWPEVDLQKGFIRLPAGMTKTNHGRSVPIHPRVKKTLESLPRGLHTDRLFLLDGKAFEEFKKSFRTACNHAGLTDFVFHDLRHCALNNLRLAGNDYFKVMAVSGHKTMSCFKRYNLVTEQELAAIKWTPEGGKTSLEATNMDTNEKGATVESA